jgi:hypothetical protein
MGVNLLISTVPFSRSLRLHRVNKMPRLNIPVFERLLISTWAIFQLMTGAIGWMILSNASNPTVPQVAHSNFPDSSSADFNSTKTSHRNPAAVRSEPNSLKQAIAQSVTLPGHNP